MAPREAGFGEAGHAQRAGAVQLEDRITLTARLGYPTLAVGVSFMM